MNSASKSLVAVTNLRLLRIMISSYTVTKVNSHIQSHVIFNVKLNLLVYQRLTSFIAMETPIIHNIKLAKRHATVFVIEEIKKYKLVNH